MAITYTYLFSETQLKQGTIIDENTDMKVIKPMILLVQDKNIEPIIGTGLMNEIKSQIAAGTLTALNTTLLESKIFPAVKHWLVYEYSLWANYKYRNKNVGTQGGDQNQPASIEDVLFLMDKHKDNAEWYSQRLIDYLSEHESDYPLYSNPGDGCDVIRPARGNNFTSNIYLGDDDCGCGNIYG